MRFNIPIVTYLIWSVIATQDNKKTQLTIVLENIYYNKLQCKNINRQKI
jgi:hypothetical protein